MHRVNYYRFLAYLLTFRNKDGETYKDVPFEKAESIYYFDKELRSLLLAVIEEIEIQLRTALAYYHGHNYGPGGYESSDSFNQKHNHELFWSYVESCIADNPNSSIIKHHKGKYGGHFPVWVIVEFFSIGELSYFYRGMKYKDRRRIAQYLYGVDESVLRSWFRCITEMITSDADHWIVPLI